jgi:DNA segregation ATPase FtsK/SpoIIIE-like protein
MNSAAMIELEDGIFSTSAHTMHSDLMGVVINTCKALPNVWQKMNEEQQQDFIDSIDRQIKELVTSCVKTIAADDRPYVLGKVDQVVFKRGIEAKLSIERDVHQEGAPSGAHELADNTGEMVMIILPGLGEYAGSEGDKPTADEDQPDLLDSASDDLYDEAVDFVTEEGKVSISALQRELKIGYNRAARLVDIMEKAGVVGELQHNGQRMVLG